MDYISNLINKQLVELTSQLFSTEDINNNDILIMKMIIITV